MRSQLIGGKSIVARRARRKSTFTVDPNEPLLATIHDVEICAVGIEYPLASGPATFTPEDLVAAVASQDDPAIVAPRVWLGHLDDDRFHTGRSTPAGSAEPAIGVVANMRVEDNGMTLVGDIQGTPTWFAKIMASAYPNRSIEGFQGAQTVTGNEYGLVITDLALLGVSWPGVTTLADIQAMYSEDGPEGVEIEEVDVDKVQAGRAVTAQVNVDDVRRAFYNAAETLKSMTGFPWIRAMQLDPNELIVDNDEGDLYRVAFTVSGDEVEFGEPKNVKIQYVTAQQAKDPSARALLVNYFVRDKKVVAAWDKRAESRPDSNNQEDPGMTPEQIRALRTRLSLSEDQLPDDATAEQINTALGLTPAPTPTSTPTSTPEPTPAPTLTVVPDPAPAPEPTPAPAPVAEVTPEMLAAAMKASGMVAVPAEAWTAVQANAAAGARVAEQSTVQRRGDILTAAIQQGRIAPAQKATFATMFDRDPEGTEKLLTARVEDGGLMPGTIPVTARGVDSSESFAASEEAYPASWLPEIQNRDAQSPTITMEA